MSLPTVDNVARPQAAGYHGRLGTLLLRFAVSPDRPLDIRTADLAAPQINTGSSPEEFRNEFGQLFSRSDFTGGEGLDYAHAPGRVASDVARFWDSQHIDISNPSPGVPSKLSLCPPTAAVDTTAITVLPLAFDGTGLHMGVGNVTRRSTDYTAANPAFAESDPGAGAAVLDLTNLGTDLYAAITGAAIYARKAGVWASLGAGSIHALKVWGLKRQLVASTGTVLQTVNTTTGASVVTLATLQTGEAWLDAADCGSAIIATATDGNLYVFGNNASAVLELKSQSLVGPTEVPYAVGWNGGQVFYGTREATDGGAIGRFYRADLDPSSFTIGNARLIKQFGDQSTVIDQAPRKIIATRDSILFGVQESVKSFVWRYDNATTGLVRYLDLGTNGVVHDLLAVGARVFCSVQGHGLYREEIGTFETTGYLVGPLGDFYTAAAKSWAGALLEHDPLPTGCRIEMYYTTDPAALSDVTSTGWVRIKNVGSGQDTTETPLVAVDARYLAGMVKLYANTAVDSSPSVKSFTFRAYPGDGDVLYDIPVSVSDEIDVPNRRRIVSRGQGARIWEALKGLEGSYIELEIFRPAELARGVVQQVGARMQTISERGTVTDTAIVRVRARRVGDTTPSDSLFGVGELAVMFLGGREVAA